VPVRGELFCSKSFPGAIRPAVLCHNGHLETHGGTWVAWGLLLQPSRALLDQHANRSANCADGMQTTLLFFAVLRFTSSAVPGVAGRRNVHLRCMVRLLRERGGPTARYDARQ
jgi:hypothetical protein